MSWSWNNENSACSGTADRSSTLGQESQAVDDPMQPLQVSGVLRVAEDCEKYLRNPRPIGVQQRQRLKRGVHTLDLGNAAGKQQPQLAWSDQSANGRGRTSSAFTSKRTPLWIDALLAEAQPAGVVERLHEVGAEDSGAGNRQDGRGRRGATARRVCPGTGVFRRRQAAGPADENGASPNMCASKKLVMNRGLRMTISQLSVSISTVT